MKLAESLQERADLNRKIPELKERLAACCLVQEGERPSEDPQALLRELDAAIDRLRFLMAAINKTNSQTVVEGRTITEWIAEKDALKLRLAAYRDLAFTAGQSTARARGTEIKVVPSVDVPALQKAADDTARRLRLADNTIQAANWQTELIED